MALQSYRELIAWQKSMELVKAIYAATSEFPREEIFGLSSQLKRASVSVPSNIAEGQGRYSTKEFIKHLSIAYGSLMEVETQVMIAQSLNFVSIDKMNSLLEKAAEVGRLINGLTRSLREKL